MVRYKKFNFETGQFYYIPDKQLAFHKKIEELLGNPPLLLGQDWGDLIKINKIELYLYF
jgi:hypothetical protein